MKIEITTAPYNERRYGRPYIAKIDFATTQGEPSWGEWVGQAGDEGILIVEAEAGDIVMTGQKDERKPRNSEPDYHLVNADGTILKMSTKADAYRQWKQQRSQKPATQELPEPTTNPLAEFTDTELLAEIARRGI